jgi:hypothetical protein
MPGRLAQAIVVVVVVALGGCKPAERSVTGPTQTTQTVPVAALPANPQAYLNEIVDLMQRYHANAARIDWVSLRGQVLGRSVQTPQDLYDAIAVGLRLLADDDSYYQTASATIVGPPRDGGCSSPAPAASGLPATVGYIRVGPCPCERIQSDRYAADLQGIVAARDHPGLTGWILDVRGNFGGSVFAMMAGVGPILGEGIAGWLRYVDREYDYTYAEGRAETFGEVFASVVRPYQVMKPNPRVAVLTDGSVASAGEALAVLFKARPDTRSFGTATCGNHHLQERFRLSDGATLHLASAQLADRLKRQYGGPVAPDEVVGDPAEALSRAIAWINQ